MIEKVAGELGLQEATLKKIRDLAYETEKKSIEFDSQLETAFLDLRRLMDADQPDEKKVMGQVDKIGALEIQLKKLHIKTLLSVREMLSPEQRQKLKQLMMQKHRRKRFGPDKRPGRPGHRGKF